MSAAATGRAPARATRVQIEQFLAIHRIAAVGVSRQERDFTRSLMREFELRGYEIVPVHPGIGEIAGRKCYDSVREIEPAVTAALLLTSPKITEQVVMDCAEAGISHIWMYKGGPGGAVSPDAVAFCHEHGMDVIAGECPFMFFPHTGMPHNLHGLIRRIFGAYPR